MRLIGACLLLAGLFVMLCGVIGLIRFRTFYRRLLCGALLDTAGLLLLLLGLAVWQGSLTFALKLLLLIGAVLLTSPLISHKLGRCAYLSGYREKEDPHD